MLNWVNYRLKIDLGVRGVTVSPWFCPRGVGNGSRRGTVSREDVSWRYLAGHPRC